MPTKNRKLTSQYALPFVVAVTGHRDLHPDDVASVRTQIREIIELVLSALPNTPIHFLSALADGTDQLFAAQVLALQRQPNFFDQNAPERIKLIVPLPMARDEYCREQVGGATALARDAQKFNLDHEAFVARFSRLAYAASSVFVIPWNKLDDDTAGRVEAARLDGIENEPYARLARYLNIHAHLVVAIWDGQTQLAGRFPRTVGGTLDVVLTRLEGFDRVKDSRSARRFAEQERGEVVHIHSRRAGQVDVAVPAETASERIGFRLLNISADSVGQILKIGEIRALSENWLGVSPPTAGEWVRTPVRASEVFQEHRVWCSLVRRVEKELARTLGMSSLAVLHRIWTVGKETNSFNRLHQRALNAKLCVTGEIYRRKLKMSAHYFVKTLRNGSRGKDGDPPRQSKRPMREQIDAMPSLVFTFSVADVLAEDAKRAWRWRWLLVAIGAVIAGASSSFKVLHPSRGELVETSAFVIGAGLAVITYLWVSLSSQRNAYLEYRALAEGLRFQMYWLAAGKDALVTDHYVQKFRSELGWVRRALDGLVVLPRTHGGLALAVARGWIQNQARYLDGRETTRRRKQNLVANNMGNRLLLLGLAFAVVALIVTLTTSAGANDVVPWLVAGMKLAPAVGAAWISYNGKMARSETLKQVEHLRVIYSRAREALDRIERNDQSVKVKEDQALDLLVALGKEALAENANWLATYQQRKVTWHGK